MKMMLYDVNFNNNIEFNFECPIRLSIESKEYFARIIKCLKLAHENIVAFFDVTGEQLKANDVLTIIDYFSIEEMIKSSLVKLYKRLEKDDSTNEDVAKNISKIVECIKEIVDVSTEGYNIEFDYMPSIELNSIFKTIALKPYNRTDSIFESLTNYLELIDRLSLYKLIVLVDIDSYLSIKEVQEIVLMCKYHRINLVLIDANYSFDKYSNETLVAIDSDYFDQLL